MSFNFMLNDSSAKLQIKKEVVITKSAAPLRITSSAPRRSRPPQVHQRNTSSTSKHLKVRKASPQVSQPRTKTGQRRSTPSQVAVTFSSDDSDVDEEIERPSKKPKQDVSQERDLKREIRCRQAFLTEGNDGFSMVHAADITSLDKGTKYIPAFEGASDTTPVVLQYPSILPTERQASQSATTWTLRSNAFLDFYS
jgi:H3 lysine-79-specific histone-lysine N-methyltransferase